jgi:hypothetical protein
VHVIELRKLEVVGREAIAMALGGETIFDYEDGSSATSYSVGYEIVLKDSTGYFRCSFDRGLAYSAEDLETMRVLCSTIRFGE